MTRTTAVRLGIPASSLARRILIPTGVVLLLLVAIASLWQADRVRQKRAFEQRSAVRTVFETSPAVLNGSGGLGTLARNRGFDRIWVLSATGDILDSNHPQEIGHPLDARWWGILKDMPSGLHQDLVAFGNQELTLVSLKAAELGRQVAVVSRPVRAGGPWILNTLGILGLSLILWGGLALLVAGILQRRVEAPTKRLDDKAMDLVRGASLSEASLDRLHAEIAAPLDGHADCMVDLARLLMQRSRQADAASLRWSALFDALPIPAFILDANHRVSEANESLLRWMSVDATWLVGRDLAIMADRVPVERLQAWLNQPATAAIGVRRWQWTPPSESPDSNLLVTVSPMPA
ncbi:MAG: hypothetical protein OXT73_11820 [Bacteroidota bacterium]|nr:hypothetical protein [Bacteroidota bacterium]